MTATDVSGHLAVRRWLEPPRNGPGVDPRSAYVDHYWTPLVGPTATSVARLLTRMVAQDASRIEVAWADLATGLGVVGPNHRVELDAAVRRLADAGIAAADGDGVLLVRSELPYLDQEQVDRLPVTLQVAHGASFALRADATPGAPPAQLGPNARLLSLAATIDEILTNPELAPRQLAYRWQHVVRLAEESRDEAILEWAPAHLEATLAEGQQRAQAMSESVWASQHALATRGALPATCRSCLSDAAAGVIDWLVSEFPPSTESWVLDHPDL
ncbi:hypothetical protein KSP35_15410 [Aquihabitans sp. G128]|uniref:hypothetical protein n=1 Tax=Aquihabitans sp. G128 TaxID=2849779 RepID=UPI001C229B03|nr:hypothetical protein [Aquihabitans sp. G128]QXC59759.1 hypothetical protein KSP35_15410 [Aquihabitans sp. G128]